MALSKVDYNSLNVTAAASKALKWNSSADGFETGDVAGAMVLLATETASSSATISFTSDIDDTYDEYIFKFINLHASADGYISFQGDTGTNTSYNQTITSTFFSAFHDEADEYPSLTYRTADDLAQSTSFCKIGFRTGNDDADMNVCGELHIFAPSSDTFVKHFYSRFSSYDTGSYACDTYAAGYFNLTTALTRFQFKMDTGNIDSGTIKLYGVT
jgi:hypothetical protein